MELDHAIAFVQRLAAEVGYSKEAMRRAMLDREFIPVGRSLLGLSYGQGHIAAIFKLIDSKGSSSSNTVTSLKNILKHDDVPFVAVFLDPNGVRFKLMNSSLVKKVSHSSQKLTQLRIVGSINGSDIVNEWAGITNDGRSLEELFALHVEEDPQENLERIVEATQGIVGRAAATAPDWELVQKHLAEGPDLLDEETMAEIEQQLVERSALVQQEILECAKRTTPKAFGDCVERIILDWEPGHALGDITYNNGRVAVDIKARQAGKASSPKAFNVQKLVDHLSAGPGAALFLMVTVDVDQNTVRTNLIHMLHPDLLPLYWHDDRWSGRNSLGTLALRGDVDAVLNAPMRLELDAPAAIARLKALLGVSL